MTPRMDLNVQEYTYTIYIIGVETVEAHAPHPPTSLATFEFQNRIHMYQNQPCVSKLQAGPGFFDKICAPTTSIPSTDNHMQLVSAIACYIHSYKPYHYQQHNNHLRITQK